MGIAANVWDAMGFGAKAEPAPTVIVQAAPDPAAVAAGEAAKAGEAPLVKQGEWFKPAETDVKPFELDTSKLFNSDPKQLSEAVGQLNFMQGMITPDIRTKIEAGGPEATDTMLALINRVGQQTMSAAMQASAKMVETAMAKAAPAMDQKVSEQLRSQRVEDAIKESNPVFASAGGKFMLDAVKTAMLAKFPNASTQEIKDNAQTLIADMLKVGGPKEEVVDKNKDIMGTDWNKILNGTM